MESKVTACLSLVRWMGEMKVRPGNSLTSSCHHNPYLLLVIVPSDWNAITDNVRSWEFTLLSPLNAIYNLIGT